MQHYDLATDKDGDLPSKREKSERALDAGPPSAQAAAIATPRKPRNHPPIGLAIGAATAIII